MKSNALAEPLDGQKSQHGNAKTRKHKALEKCIVCGALKPFSRMDMTRPEFFCGDEHEEQFFRQHGIPLELRFEWKPENVPSDPSIVVVNRGIFRRVVLARRQAGEQLRLQAAQAYSEMREKASKSKRGP